MTDINHLEVELLDWWSVFVAEQKCHPTILQNLGQRRCGVVIV